MVSGQRLQQITRRLSLVMASRDFQFSDQHELAGQPS
jgi:hypothetical protein